VSDSFDLQRFVDAQAPVYRQVVEELSRGRKRTHWMWFIFPQIAGLGSSAMAQRFAIGSHVEAVAYLEHDLLGPRLQASDTGTPDGTDSRRHPKGAATGRGGRRHQGDARMHDDARRPQTRIRNGDQPNAGMFS
jgi:hypothetical protein